MTTASLRERLEARITSDQKELLREAAAVRGVSLSDFVVNSAHEAAVRVLEQTRVLEVSRRDQRALVDVLLNPPKPNTALRTAARRHGYITKSR